MSESKKKYIILPYEGSVDKLKFENIETKLTTHVKMDDIHKFLRYVYTLEELAFAAKDLENSNLKKYFNKIENIGFCYAIPAEKN